MSFKPYSQYGEDTILKDILGESGYFLEIGAFHPFVFSNTRFLVERGWGGCYVDGSPSATSRFVEEYAENDNITIVNCLVGSVNTLTSFYDSLGDGISSIDEKHIIPWKSSGSKFKKIHSSMIDMDTLCGVLPSNVDFINIDVEGQSASLATLIDYRKLNTKVVCIEHDNMVPFLRDHFKHIGFTQHYVNSCNVNVIFTR